MLLARASYRKKILIWWVILTGINLLIFLYRDAFQYQPFASEGSLYNSGTERWENFEEAYPAPETALTKKLTDSIIAASREKDRPMALASFLYSRYHNRYGMPGKEFSYLTAYQKYLWLEKVKEEKVWCGNLSEFYAYFCAVQGIVCRNVEIMKGNDHHVFNEYFDREKEQWVMVDLTHDILRLSNDSGRHLTAVQYAIAGKNGSVLIAERAAPDGSTEKQKLPAASLQGWSYYGAQWPWHYYRSFDGKTIFSPKEKLKRYFLPLSWYDIYNKDGDNLLFYCKEFFVLLWLIVTVMALLSFKNDKL